MFSSMKKFMGLGDAQVQAEDSTQVVAQENTLIPEEPVSQLLELSISLIACTDLVKTNMFASDHQFVSVAIGQFKEKTETKELTSSSKGSLIWASLEFKTELTDVVLRHCNLSLSLYNHNQMRADSLVGVAVYSLLPLFMTTSMPPDKEVNLVAEIKEKNGKSKGNMSIKIKIEIIKDIALEKQQEEERKRVDDEYFAATAKLRGISSLAETMTHFGYTLADKIEHKEIVIMFRQVQKAIEFHIHRLLESDGVGSAAHFYAKETRRVLDKIRDEFDFTYNLTKTISFIPRPISAVSKERLFIYNMDTGRMNVNFESLKLPELPHFLIAFRSTVLPLDLQV